MGSLTPQEAQQIAEEAYIYAFPMLMGYRFADGAFLNPSAPGYRGPINAIHGKAATLDHTFKDVITPNADTPYSFGMLDLRAEPIVIQVPQVTDRYYVLQLEDLFGQNAHYIGSRATGSKAGSYLVVGPRWDGEVGDEFDGVLPFETDLVFVLGRTQLLGADDVKALDDVMAGYQVQPLSAYRGQTAPTAPPTDWMPWVDEESRDERFIGYVNFLLSFCQPTHPSETEMMSRFARIGIEPGKPFEVDAIDDELRQAIRAGVSSAREAIVAAMPEYGKVVNGWQSAEVFGTRQFFGSDYMLRAVGAMAGWGGNDAIEAFYPTARWDGDGNPLDGAHRYQLELDTLPPCKAFWSVTMYDTSYDGTAGYLVENPIDRFLINSNTPGLVYGDDGSLTITIQRTEPQDATERANWLPAPEGPFYLTLRIYWPEQAALDGTWTPPPIRRVE
jgi:hypothetical protein